jgi:hypothetical protein
MKKIIIIASIILALVLAIGIAAPVFAADPGGTSPIPTQGAGKIGRGVILARILLIQDEAKVIVMLNKAVEAGKITSEQADKIHAFWTLNHEKAAKRVILRGLNRIQDEARLMEFVNEALDNGRITQHQADRITAAWHKIHDK